MAEPTRSQSPRTHPESSAKLDDPARRLWRLWRQDQQPRVEDFLAQAGIRDPDGIVAVLRVDQWERFRLGQPVPAETYLDAFPVVQDESEHAVELVLAEYLLREEIGERPGLEEYLQRFPRYADELRLQIELHRAMETDRALPPTRVESTGLLDCRQSESPGGSEALPTIPGYEILNVLGWGGMGVVYRAWQQTLNRTVALKMVHAGAHSSPQVLARVRVEAVAVARLRHPNIVQIYEVGQHAGSPFLVLELVEGPSLAKWLDGRPQQAGRAVELVETLARALHTAHRQGVVHRDLTPANILLAADGTPKITDFGLAKLVIGGGDLRTQTGELLGTPSYMAPEQAASRHHAIGAATDVYALGAILYEVLTGRPPFVAESPLETLRQVMGDEPVAPSRLRPGLPRDLETICLKCLRKEPAQRYASALALADELRRFLEGRPILARPSTVLEQFWRWCRRNPLPAATSIAASAAILLLAIGATVAAVTFRDQRDQIGRQRDQINQDLIQIRQAEINTRENLFAARTTQARAERLSRSMGQRFRSLETLATAVEIGWELGLPPEKFAALRDEAIASLALPDLRPTDDRVIRRPAGVILLAFDSSMTRYALRFRDGTILVRRASNDDEIARFQVRGRRDMYLLRFSPDGRFLATQHDPGFALTVWDLKRRAVTVEDPGPVLSHSADFSPDSRQIAVARHDGAIRVYDLATGQPRPRFRVPAPLELVFRPDGAQIAVISSERNQSSCCILEAESGQLIRSIALPCNGRVAWSPDGATLATACDNRKIYLWDAATGTRKASLEGHSNSGLLAAFHPAGTLLASDGWENRLRLWDPVLRRPWLSLPNESSTQFTQFSKDGRIVVSGEGQLITYEVDPALEYRTFAHASGFPIDYGRAAMDRDGRILALGTGQGVALWDLARGTEMALLPIGNAWHLIFESSGSLLTSGTLGVWRWPIQHDPDRRILRVGPPHQLDLPAGLGGIAEDGPGRIVAKANFGAAYAVTSDREFQFGPLDDGRSVAVSPDGKWLATGSHSVGAPQIWCIADGSEVAKLPIEGLINVIFSPDGKWLMTTNPPCRLWTVGTWREARQIRGTGQCFSPDGRALVVQDANKVLRLVETETCRTLAQLESPDLCTVWWATFSSDGSRLVITTNDGPAVHVWDLRAIRRRLAAMGLDWKGPPLPAPETSHADAEDRPSFKVIVDFGPLKRYSDQYQSHLEQYTVPAEELVTRHSERLRAHPDDADSLHQRGHALLRLNRVEEALADFSAARAVRPLDAHSRAYQGVCLFVLNRYAEALDHLERAFQTDPETVRAIITLDQVVNDRAWELATGAAPQGDSVLAARMAAFAVALSPTEPTSLNTLGVALYRAGRFDEAIPTLEESLKVGRGHFAAFDLFFLAMAHHRLGQRDEAKSRCELAVRWLQEHKNLSAQHAKELALLRAEAEAVLAVRGGELPAHVFAGPE
jgi:serine/threonine protein kinase/WD40 repeat protein/tetratricopeptide (TPR) repeat protein